jgi:hypothetical protein
MELRNQIMLMKVNATTWVNPRTVEPMLLEHMDDRSKRRLWIESAARPGVAIEVDGMHQDELIRTLENCLAERARRQES